MSQDRAFVSAAVHVLVAAGFVFLAVALSYPLVLQLGTHVPGTGDGDNLAFLWNFWWARQALQDPAADLFHTDRLFAPFGAPLVLHTHTALQASVGSTVLGRFSPVEALNLVLLAGLALNGIATYALAYRLVGRVLPAALAGVIFASSAYVTVHLLGHFNLVHAWVLPLGVLALLGLLEGGSLWRAVPAGIAFTLALYTDYYYTLYLALFALVWLIVGRRAWTISGRPLRPRWLGPVVLSVLLAALGIAAVILITGGGRLELGRIAVSATSATNPLVVAWLAALAWIALRIRLTAGKPATRRSPTWLVARGAIVLAVVLVLAWPILHHALALMLQGDYVAPVFRWRSAPRGVDLMTPFLGHPLHFLYGESVRGAYGRLGIDLAEQVAWIGIAPLIVLFVAVRHLRTPAPHVRPWLWVAAFFFIWSAGSSLVVGGIDSELPLPEMLARTLPVLSNARMPGRAFVMVHLGVALACAIVVAEQRWRSPAIAALLLLAVADGLPAPFPTTPVPLPGAVERAIEQDAHPGSVLELPLGIRDGLEQDGRFDHRALVHQMAHGRPVVGGFVARLPERVRDAYVETPALSALLALSEGDLVPNDLPADLAARLDGLGVRYVIVNADTIDGDVGAALERLGLERIAVDEARAAYLVAPSTAPLDAPAGQGTRWGPAPIRAQPLRSRPDRDPREAKGGILPDPIVSSAFALPRACCRGVAVARAEE